jgi:hypothetical protein
MQTGIFRSILASLAHARDASQLLLLRTKWCTSARGWTGGIWSCFLVRKPWVLTNIMFLLTLMSAGKYISRLAFGVKEEMLALVQIPGVKKVLQLLLCPLPNIACCRLALAGCGARTIAPSPLWPPPTRQRWLAPSTLVLTGPGMLQEILAKANAIGADSFGLVELLIRLFVPLVRCLRLKVGLSSSCFALKTNSDPCCSSRAP